MRRLLRIHCNIRCASQREPNRRALFDQDFADYVRWKAALKCWTFGSECDSAFAQHSKARSQDVHKVRCTHTNVELENILCAYSSAKNMLCHTGIEGATVLVVGAGGGVGAAATAMRASRPWLPIALSAGKGIYES